ncbi:MAG: outer membrane beta-barrel protein [Acidobacteriota bacterium]
MRKLTTVLIIILAITFLNAAEESNHKKLSLTIGAGIRNVSQNTFETVYGTNNIAYSIDFAFTIKRSFEIFLHSDYLSAKGSLEFDPKDSTLTIFPAELGVRIVLGKKLFTPYLGLGGGYYMFKEENFIGTVDESQIGFFGEGGFRFNFKGTFFIDLKLKYNILNYDMNGTDVDLGGLSYYGGIGIRF